MRREPQGDTGADTLFPYTTVFGVGRDVSEAGDVDLHQAGAVRHAAVQLQDGEVAGRHLRDGAVVAVEPAGEPLLPLAAPAPAPDLADEGLDRKSTRLNSSH